MGNTGPEQVIVKAGDKSGHACLLRRGAKPLLPHVSQMLLGVPEIIVSADPVIAAGVSAAVLESGVRNRRDTNPDCRAFRTVPCPHGPHAGHEYLCRRGFRKGNPGVAWQSPQRPWSASPLIGSSVVSVKSLPRYMKMSPFAEIDLFQKCPILFYALCFMPTSGIFVPNTSSTLPAFARTRLLPDHVCIFVG